MNATLDKPQLWSLRDAAEILGLSDDNGYRLVSVLVRNHEIPTRRISTALCIDYKGLEVLAKALNRRLS